MANRWGIPKDVETFVKERDSCCVYCGIEFSDSKAGRKSIPSWEHIINDIRINGVDNISLCCMSCNASKGAKPLEDWFQSEYCEHKKIGRDTVAKVIKEALLNPPKLK